jgi:hypothetical protein
VGRPAGAAGPSRPGSLPEEGETRTRSIFPSRHKSESTTHFLSPHRLRRGVWAEGGATPRGTCVPPCVCVCVCLLFPNIPVLIGGLGGFFPFSFPVPLTQRLHSFSFPSPITAYTGSPGDKRAEEEEEEWWMACAPPQPHHPSFFPQPLISKRRLPFWFHPPVFLPSSSSPQNTQRESERERERERE